MRNFIAGIFAALIAAAGLGAFAWIVMLPRLDWGASNPPGTVEQALARNVLGRWIHRNARAGTNPIVPTAETLKAARTEYEAHCAFVTVSTAAAAIGLKQSSIRPWQS
jgi:hypothetical protein